MLKISVIVIVTLAIFDVNLANIFNWFTKIPKINEEMERIYNSKILPLEKNYFFNEFTHRKLEDGYFDAKPMLVFIGQYSTGTVGR
jgi:hypothetical protein